MPNLANILGLLGMGGGNQGYNPDPQTMGLLAQLNRDNNGMPEPDRPVPSQLQQQLNRHPQFGLLNAPQSQAPGLPIFAGNPDIPAMNATQAGPMEAPAPMPPVRPAGLGFNTPMPPERPAPAMAPMASPAAPMAPPAQQQANQPGFFDKLGTAIGSIYGGGSMPGDNLIALGAGLMSGPNAGAGLMKGMAMVNANNMTADKRVLEREQARQKLLGLSGSIETLRKAYPGMSDAQYAAMAQQPQVMQEAVKRLGGQDTFKPVTDPAERLRLGIDPNDKGIYQTDREGKLMAVGTPSTNVNVNSAANPILEGLGKQVVEGRANASAAGNSLRTLNEARTQLDSQGGIFSGFGAERRLDIAKVGALFGITDPKAIANTETFRSTMGGVVLEAVKGLGAGAGISNADRDFAEKMAGGSINLDEQSIRRAIDITERAARYKIQSHNELVDKVITQIPNMAPMAGALRIEAPEPYKAPEKQQPQLFTPQAGQGDKPPVEGARKAADGNYYVPDPQRPGKYLRVQ